MKRIVAILLTALMCIGVMGAFAVTSYAAENTTVPKDEIESTLSVPEGSQYVFYAQTRTNRLDASKKDVRILCVADEAWIASIPTLVATVTFTDGETPVTLKSIGLNTVFKSITAYGSDGNVETFAAAEGAVIFGFIVTEVPEAYADVATNAPTVTVVTEEGTEPDSVIGDDYETPILEMDDINVETDGIYKDVETDLNGKVGGFDHNTSKATYLVSGNYEGYYDMTIAYTDMDARRLGVVVNGVAQIVKVEDTTSDWNDVSVAKTLTVTVKLKKGVNVISFMRTDYFGFNLVDFDLTKNTTYTVGESVTVGVEDDPVFDGGVIETCTNGAKKVGWIGVDGGKNRTVTYTVEIPTEGKYFVAIDYLFGDDPNRKFSFSIDDGEETAVRIVKGESNDDETYALVTAFYADFTAGTHTITIGGYEGWAPNFLGMTLTEITAE